MIEKQKYQLKASVVMHIWYKDNPNHPFTFYSYDINKRAGDVNYWMGHMRFLAEKKWAGKVRSFVIFPCTNGEKSGDALFKWDDPEYVWTPNEVNQ